MRRPDTTSFVAIVAIACCLGVPIILSAGTATLLLAAGISMPAVLLVAGTVWLWRSRRLQRR